MSPPYQVVFVHKELTDFARAVETTIRASATDVLIQPDLLDFKHDMSEARADAHVVVVYLGSTDGRQDGTVTTALRDAVRRSFPVLPIVRNREPGAIPEKLPPVIEHINAADWDKDTIGASLVLLGMLGLVERERKVFLSYRQRDSTQIAVQLHTELVRSRFDVFLDRFALPPGEDFQKRLDEDLSDKAFIVLLESADLRSSPWVQHEIAYAHSHRIDVLALTLPGTSDTQLVPAIDEAFRVRLHERDCTDDGCLNTATLSSILERIELAHARALRRRREQMIGSLTDKLHRDGCACAPLENWAIWATGDGKVPSVFLVTPRRPQPEDLYATHLLRRYVAGRTGRADMSAAVVHETEHMAEERRRVLTWIGESGQLAMRRLRECALDEDAAA